VILYNIVTKIIQICNTATVSVVGAEVDGRKVCCMVVICSC